MGCQTANNDLTRNRPAHSPCGRLPTDHRDLKESCPEVRFNSSIHTVNYRAEDVVCCQHGRPVFFRRRLRLEKCQ
ncbi:MAG: hypothetical protein DWH78_04555 [Planctomycetota bacterium]|nr:MAG: hypothetical protein DWH78_04555 [Planctomycetota bacterium]